MHHGGHWRIWPAELHDVLLSAACCIKYVLLSCFTGSTVGLGRSYGPATIQSFLTHSAASGRSG